MSWLKLDDGFPDHPKVVRLDDAAFRCHVSAMCYVARAGTDGFVPVSMVQRLHPDGSKLTSQLVQAGVWEPCEGGFAIHDYLAYNPSKAEGEALRQKRADAGRRGGLHSGGSRQPADSEANDEANAQALASGSASSKRQAKRNPVPVPVRERSSQALSAVPARETINDSRKKPKVEPKPEPAPAPIPLEERYPDVSFFVMGTPMANGCTLPCTCRGAHKGGLAYRGSGSQVGTAVCATCYPPGAVTS